jgi:hypothetical protein
MMTQQTMAAVVVVGEGFDGLQNRSVLTRRGWCCEVVVVMVMPTWRVRYAPGHPLAWQYRCYCLMNGVMA